MTGTVLGFDIVKTTFSKLPYTSYGVEGSQTLTLGPIFGLDGEDPNDPNKVSCQHFLENQADHCRADFFTYNGLYADLQSAGFSPSTFPYDWRRDVRAIADDLYRQVISMRATAPARPVAIIAHSLGGLVVSAMLRRHPELYSSGDLGDIVLLGTPLKGGLKAFAALRGFMSPLEAVFSPQNALDLTGNWPSVFQLMPRYDFLDDPRTFIAPNFVSPRSFTFAEVYSGNVRTDLKGFFPPLLSQGRSDADAFWADMLTLQPYPRAHAIVGTGQPTLSKMKVESRAILTPCVQGIMGDGDGTVPYSGSLKVENLWIPSSEFRYINELHTGLPGNLDVRNAVLSTLGTGNLPTNLVLLAAPNNSTIKPLVAFHKCSPIDLTITDAAGGVVSKDVSTISDVQRLVIGGSAEYFLPSGGNYTVKLKGTGKGAFTFIVRQIAANNPGGELGIFNTVPVTTASSGTIVLNNGVLSGLAYDYAGKGIMDTIPPNVVPPTIQCTGCYFTIQNLRATLAFNAGYQGGVSTFNYNYRNATQTVQFVSTRTSQISVSGKTATFAGQGTLNGQSGYNFTVNAKDGGVAGSSLDTVSIAVTGPNSYSYTVNGTIVGGDVVVTP